MWLREVLFLSLLMSCGLGEAPVCVDLLCPTADCKEPPPPLCIGEPPPPEAEHAARAMLGGVTFGLSHRVDEGVVELILLQKYYSGPYVDPDKCPPLWNEDSLHPNTVAIWRGLEWSCSNESWSPNRDFRSVVVELSKRQLRPARCGPADGTGFGVCDFPLRGVSASVEYRRTVGRGQSWTGYLEVSLIAVDEAGRPR